ncbi:MAG: DegV family protein [Deltaproteobacteria bacterium]|nr:DegV family protein [Deltaproteobacteria bacterium]
MAQKVGIVVDSPADFPEGMVEKHGIHILPVHIFVDGVDHLHGINITNNDVIEHMKTGSDVHTTPFFPSECADFYEELLTRYDKIVSFHLSTHLSDNFRSAKSSLNLLYDNDAERVHIIDLESVSISQGMIVKKAIDLIKGNCELSALENLLKPYMKSTRMWFTVDDLAWLKKGGRVSSFSAFVGGMLDIKPIIGLEGAKLVPMEKHRGKKLAIKRIVEMAEAANKKFRGDCDFCVAYSDNIEEVMITREKLAERTGRRVEDIDVVQVGATISVHTGPGSVALAMLPN